MVMGYAGHSRWLMNICCKKGLNMCGVLRIQNPFQMDRFSIYIKASSNFSFFSVILGGC